jgi:hypothetical protein
VIILDVDSKDASLGMSCPPAAFIDTNLLRSVSESLNPLGKDPFYNMYYFSRNRRIDFSGHRSLTHCSS